MYNLPDKIKYINHFIYNALEDLMEYNKYLDIYNLKQNDFKDDMMLSLAAIVYLLKEPLAQLEKLVEAPNFNKKNNILFVGPACTDVIRQQTTELISEIKESEYAHIYQASIHAMNALYREKIFADIKKHYTEVIEIDKDLVAVGELDAEAVVEFTDDDYNLHLDLALIPNLAFINLAFYVTYKGQYDILKLDDIDNPEFWYNKYFDLFLHNMNYRNFVTL